MKQDWRREVAEKCLELVRSANYGRLPGKSIETWVEVAERFDVLVVVADPPGNECAVLMDDVIVVRPGRSRRQTCLRIAHELAEYLLCTEMARPYYYTVWPGVSPDAERHLVAREVEALLKHLRKAQRYRACKSGSQRVNLRSSAGKT